MKTNYIHKNHEKIHKTLTSTNLRFYFAFMLKVQQKKSMNKLTTTKTNKNPFTD